MFPTQREEEACMACKSRKQAGLGDTERPPQVGTESTQELQRMVPYPGGQETKEEGGMLGLTQSESLHIHGSKPGLQNKAHLLQSPELGSSVLVLTGEVCCIFIPSK